jgi:hypothetical protein
MANDDTPQEENKTRFNVEILRVILDFLSRCFYPAIIISILWAVWPTVSSIDFNTLIKGLQSAKVGDFEFTFDQAQEVGAEIAPLNAKISELERQLKLALSDIKEIKEPSKTTKPTKDDIEKFKKREEELKSNAEYTVLIFHRFSSRDRATAITQGFLRNGYQSSDTETDFTELQKVKPEENVVYVTYTSRGAEILSKVLNEIALISPDAIIRQNPRPINLRRGDIQILVF